MFERIKVCNYCYATNLSLSKLERLIWFCKWLRYTEICINYRPVIQNDGKFINLEFKFLLRSAEALELVAQAYIYYLIVLCIKHTTLIRPGSVIYTKIFRVWLVSEWYTTHSLNGYTHRIPIEWVVYPSYQTSTMVYVLILLLSIYRLIIDSSRTLGSESETRQKVWVKVRIKTTYL